jgi:hypothetical protein
MKKLKFKEPYNHHYEYADDIDRIVKVFADRGYEISRECAVKSWEAYSESYAAGWMSMRTNGDDDEYIFNSAFPYFEVKQ